MTNDAREIKHKLRVIKPAEQHGDILGFAPPLITTKEDVDYIISNVKAAVDEVTDTLVQDGIKIA